MNLIFMYCRVHLSCMILSKINDAIDLHHASSVPSSFGNANELLVVPNAV